MLNAMYTALRRLARSSRLRDYVGGENDPMRKINDSHSGFGRGTEAGLQVVVFKIRNTNDEL